MPPRSPTRAIARLIGAAAAAAVAGYGLYAGATWLRYGRPRRPPRGEADALLDHFMPMYDVVERHHVRVAAPADLTLATACDMELLGSPVPYALIRVRELLLGARPGHRPDPRGLLDEVRALGWVVLAETTGRELVVGAVTRPWEANVTFRSIAPEAFAEFAEPGYVKIAWTLRADPVGATASIFRTETRVVATDAAARRRFRTYWAWLSPGIILIRLAFLSPLKTQAERRWRAAGGAIRHV
jgi:hypothetical protein